MSKEENQIIIDSRVKSQFWEDISVIKMRKMGVKNTFDAGVIIRKTDKSNVLLGKKGKMGNIGRLGWVALGILLDF